MKRLEERVEPERYVVLPDEWLTTKNLFLLHVTSCRHFRKEGIRKGVISVLMKRYLLKKGSLVLL